MFHETIYFNHIYFKNTKKAEAFRTTSVFSTNIQVKVKTLKLKL